MNQILKVMAGIALAIGLGLPIQDASVKYLCDHPKLDAEKEKTVVDACKKDTWLNNIKETINESSK